MRGLLIVFLAFLSTIPFRARAQTWSSAQQEVWQFVEESWVADTSEDPNWIDRMVHPNFRGWDVEYPMPRNLETFKKWSRYSDENSQVLVYSVYPVAIVVEGNTAMAFYYGSIAVEDQTGEQKTTHFREVDVLIREGGHWKFLGWFGADQESGEG